MTLLAMSGVTVVNNEGGRRDDRKDFAETLSSLETVGVKGNGQQNLFTIVAVILHLSNIQVRVKVGKVANL